MNRSRTRNPLRLVAIVLAICALIALPAVALAQSSAATATSPPVVESWNTGQIIVAVYGHPLVRAVGGLLVANVLAGIAISAYKRRLYLAQLGDWLLTRAVPYLIGAGAVQIVLLSVPPEWSGVTEKVASTVWLFVIAGLLGHILDTLREIGLPIPARLGEKPKVEATATP